MSGERIAAGVLLRRGVGRDERWLLLRSTRWGEWGWPKGHSETGESPEATARRECAEECGIGLLTIDGPDEPLRYRLKDGTPKIVHYFPACTEQHLTTLSDEHDAARWCRADEVLRLLPHTNARDHFRHHLTTCR